MMAREVLCISKSDRESPYERITHIGGKMADGSRWKIPLHGAITGIKSGRWSFYVSRGGSSVDVVVSVSKHGHEYLRTAADGKEPNNLLSLPECP